MERTLISWNLVNWFTVLLMGLAGYVLFLCIAQIVQRAQSAAPMRQAA